MSSAHVPIESFPGVHMPQAWLADFVVYFRDHDQPWRLVHLDERAFLIAGVAEEPGVETYATLVISNVLSITLLVHAQQVQPGSATQAFTVDTDLNVLDLLSPAPTIH